jgi:hypothetical protein
MVDVQAVSRSNIGSSLWQPWKMDMNEPCSKEEERQCIGEEGMIG